MSDSEFNELLKLCKNLRAHIDVKSAGSGKALAFRFRSDSDNEFKRLVRPEEIRADEESFGAAMTRWLAFVDGHEVEVKVERNAGVTGENKIG